MRRKERRKKEILVGFENYSKAITWNEIGFEEKTVRRKRVWFDFDIEIFGIILIYPNLLYSIDKQTIVFSFSIDDPIFFFVTITTKNRIDRYRSIHIYIYIYIVWISHQEQPRITQFASKNRWWINDEPSWLLFLSYRTLNAESRRVVCVSRYYSWRVSDYDRVDNWRYIR